MRMTSRSAPAASCRCCCYSCVTNSGILVSTTAALGASHHITHLHSSFCIFGNSVSNETGTTNYGTKREMQLETQMESDTSSTAASEISESIGGRERERRAGAQRRRKCVFRFQSRAAHRKRRRRRTQNAHGEEMRRGEERRHPSHAAGAVRCGEERVAHAAAS